MKRQISRWFDDLYIWYDDRLKIPFTRKSNNIVYAVSDIIRYFSILSDIIWYKLYLKISHLYSHLTLYKKYQIISNYIKLYQIISNYILSSYEPFSDYNCILKYQIISDYIKLYQIISNYIRLYQIISNYIKIVSDNIFLPWVNKQL